MSGEGIGSSGDHRRDRTPPAPEGVNLLGTPERVEQNGNTARGRYAIGSFGQAWLWTIGGVLTVAGLYKALVGPLIAATLPTTTGTVVGWTMVPGRSITYLPRISYEVGGTSHEFVSGTAVGTLTGAPTTVTVSYVPFTPQAAIWNSGQWWQGFFDTYLMVTLILGLILFCVAIYQWRIRGYWRESPVCLRPGEYRQLIGYGVAAIAGGGLWLLSGYASPVSWYLPPDPNVLAAFVAAMGVALLTSGLHHRSRYAVAPLRFPSGRRGFPSE